MSEAATVVAAPATPADSQSGDNQESQGDQSQQAAATPPKKKAPVYRQYKVGNETVNLTDEDVARDYSKWKGGDKALREANQEKQKVDAFKRAFLEDPDAVLSDPRIPKETRHKLAEKWLTAEIEEEIRNSDPRDKKLSEAERRLKEYEDREAAENQTKEEAEKSQAIQARKTTLSTTLSKAMEATPLSKHPESAAATLREMALYMRAAKEQGEEVTADQIVEHIHNNRFHQMYTLANQFQGEDLLDFLGDEVAARVAQAHLARIKAKRGDPGQSHKSESWSTRDQKPGRGERLDATALRQRTNRLLAGK